MTSDDRSAQGQAGQAGREAASTAGTYGAEAGNIFGTLAPTLSRWTSTPPGFSPQDLSMMESTAGQKAAGTTGNLQEEARLRAMRSRNMAGLTGQQDAIAQAAARAQGQDVQNILGENAKLQAAQQEEAVRGLGGLYGEAMRGQLGSQENETRDIMAKIEAGKTGWFQNMTNLLGTLAGPFRVTAQM